MIVLANLSFSVHEIPNGHISEEQLMVSSLACILPLKTLPQYIMAASFLAGRPVPCR